MADLRSFRSEWVEPISTSYKGYDVYETPPQTQGFATLEMLNIIEQCGPRLGYDLQALGAKSPQFWHILIEAKKLAYADLLRYNGDPRFLDVPLDRLLSKGYAASLCSRIDLDHASAPASAAKRAGPSLTIKEKGDTVYLVAADRWGNMASSSTRSTTTSARRCRCPATGSRSTIAGRSSHSTRPRRAWSPRASDRS
jgi:gamma-glutamyltranspeptidase / glutathione hydrolase